MATKVEIIYEAEATSLKATVNEVNKANDAVAASAKESSKEVADAYKSAGKSIAAAFSGGEVKKALADQNKGFEQLNSKGKTLTGQLRALKNELTQLEAAGQDGTAQFQQLTIAAARLEDQIGDTRQRVSILASDTFKFDAAIGALQGLAAGFQVAEGASALFGAENEDLQKALLKLNAIIAISTGLEQINKLVKEESAVKTAVLTAKQAIYTTVVGTSTGALKAFRIALAATGVGLLVFGLIALVENFDKVKRALENSIPGFKAVSNAIGDAVDTIKEWVGASDDAERAGAAFDAATKKQNEAADAVVKSYERRIAVEKAAGRSTTQLEIEREQAVIAANEKILKDYRNKSTELVKLDEEQKQKAVQLAKDAADAIAESQNNILVIRAEAAKKAADAAKANAEAIAKAELETFRNLLNETAALQNEFDKQQAEERKNNEAKLQVDLTDLADTSLETQLDDRLNFLKRLEIEEGSNLDRRINIIELEGKKRIAAAEGNANEIKLIEAETQQAIREEQKRTADEQLDNLFNIAQATANVLGQIIELQGVQSQKRIDEINASSEAEKLAIEQSALNEAQKQRKLEALQLRTAQKVAAEKRRQAVAEKASAIFEATIGTAVAVASAKGPILKALALASGLAQIALIASQPIPKFKKGGAVGGRSHEAGGTLIEAERGEFVVNKASTSRHRTELDALNTSSAAFRKLIDQRYVRPAILSYANKRKDGITVNASLNSKSMERKLDKLNKTMSKQRTVVNINGFDSRYSWQQN
jgi:hypothetical protein